MRRPALILLGVAVVAVAVVALLMFHDAGTGTTTAQGATAQHATAQRVSKAQGGRMTATTATTAQGATPDTTTATTAATTAQGATTCPQVDHMAALPRECQPPAYRAYQDAQDAGVALDLDTEPIDRCRNLLACNDALNQWASNVLTFDAVIAHSYSTCTATPGDYSHAVSAVDFYRDRVSRVRSQIELWRAHPEYPAGVMLIGPEIEWAGKAASMVVAVC
jgi:hypothetical protein